MKSSLSRFSSLPLFRGGSLPNRLVVPPMASGTASEAGLVTPVTLVHYARLAESGAGLVMVEYSYVHSSGRSEANQLGVAGPEHGEGLRKLASTLHSAGARTVLQLTHAGGKGDPELAGGELMAPSAVKVPVKGAELATPRAMTMADIQMWRESFVRAADLAAAAGFDGVELHAAHGYGLNQWLSPLTNQRHDEYGGPLEGRARLLLEIVDQIRAKNPQLWISVRLPGQDFLPGGLARTDMQWLARELVARGVDFLNVSSGIGGWRRPAPRVGEGYLVEEARAIQSEVIQPVIGVGGIESGDYIDHALQNGWLSLAAVGRAILRDPQAWRERWMLPRPLACSPERH